MAKSRYRDTGIDGNHFKTFSLPSISKGYVTLNLLDGVSTVDYTFTIGDRLDHLAARFLGDDQYWWVIALVNNINYPFASGGLIPGRVLKIPVEIEKVLNKIMR